MTATLDGDWPLIYPAPFPWRDYVPSKRNQRLPFADDRAFFQWIVTFYFLLAVRFMVIAATL